MRITLCKRRGIVSSQLSLEQKKNRFREEKYQRVKVAADTCDDSYNPPETLRWVQPGELWEVYHTVQGADKDRARLNAASWWGLVLLNSNRQRSDGIKTLLSIIRSASERRRLHQEEIESYRRHEGQSPIARHFGRGANQSDEEEEPLLKMTSEPRLNAPFHSAGVRRRFYKNVKKKKKK